MAVAVEITFPWGRYHATAWDRNANEGVPDWPPAPWRILRALYAAWQWYCPDLDRATVEGLLTKMSAAPRYQLPRFTLAHTRHYYPGDAHLRGVRGRADTVKTFDAFVVTERGGRVVVEYPVELDGTEREALRRLTAELGYLGRAETIVEARLLESPPDGDWLEPSPDDLPTAGGLDLLAATEPLDLAALTLRPRAVRAGRHRRPPGTRWVTYAQPSPVLPAAVTARAEPPRAEAVRFALTGSSLPAATDAVLVGDYLRRASLARYGGTPQDVSAVLAGKRADGTRVQGRHAHAHYLVFSAERSRRSVDTAVVWAPAGLTGSDLDAVTSLRQLRGYHQEALRDGWLGVEALGPIDAVAPELCGPSAVWCTVTPFAPTRHGKGGMERTIADNVRLELRHRGLPDEVEVEIVRGHTAALQFRRHRAGEQLGGARRAYHLRLRFAEPVTGPLALGQLSHFGLGLFLPDASDG